MDDSTLLKQARDLPDDDSNVALFFSNLEALQVRIDALTRSGTFSAKKAIYIMQNVDPGYITFPKEFAGQIYIQLSAPEFSSQETLDRVTSYFSEPASEIEKLIAIEILNRDNRTNSFVASREPKSHNSQAFDFQLIANNIGALALLANDNWDQWLARAAEICAVTIDTPKTPDFEIFLETAYKTFKETLELVDPNDLDKLSADIAAAIFRHFPGDSDEHLQEACDLAQNLGIKDPEKNIRWQQMLFSPNAQSARELARLFKDEPPISIANLVTQSITNSPESQIHGRLGNAIAQIMISSDFDQGSKRAIVNKLKLLRERFGFSAQSQSLPEFSAIDLTIKGLIVNIANQRQYRNFPDSEQKYSFLAIDDEIRKYLIDAFKDDYLRLIIESNLTSEQESINLVAQQLGTDPRTVDDLTSGPNGLELLDTLRQQRVGIPTAANKLASQRQGFQSDAGQAWSNR